MAGRSITRCSIRFVQNQDLFTIMGEGPTVPVGPAIELAREMGHRPPPVPPSAAVIEPTERIRPQPQYKRRTGRGAVRHWSEPLQAANASTVTAATKTITTRIHILPGELGTERCPTVRYPGCYPSSRLYLS